MEYENYLSSESSNSTTLESTGDCDDSVGSPVDGSVTEVVMDMMVTPVVISGNLRRMII